MVPGTKIAFIHSRRARSLAACVLLAIALAAFGLAADGAPAMLVAAARRGQAPPDQVAGGLAPVYLPWVGKPLSPAAEPGTLLTHFGGGVQVIAPLDAAGDRLAAGMGARVVVFDAADGARPRLIWSGPAFTEAVVGLAVEGDRLFADMFASLAVFDIRDPAAPRLLNQWFELGDIQAVDGSVLYLWRRGAREPITLVDVADPRRPVVVGALEPVEPFPTVDPFLADFLTVSQGFAYLVRQTETSCEHGPPCNVGLVLEVFDVHDPHEPAKVYWAQTDRWPAFLQRVGDHLFTGYELMYSLADPRRPVPIHSQSFARIGQIDALAAEGDALVIASQRSLGRYAITQADAAAFEMRLESEVPFDPACADNPFHLLRRVTLNARRAWLPGGDGRLCTLQHGAGAPAQWVGDLGPWVIGAVVPGRPYTYLQGSRGWLAVQPDLLSAGGQAVTPIPVASEGSDAGQPNGQIRHLRAGGTLYAASRTYRERIINQLAACDLSDPLLMRCAPTIDDPDFPIEQLVADEQGMTTFGQLPGLGAERGLAFVDIGAPLAPRRGAFIPGDLAAFDRDNGRVYALRSCPDPQFWCLDVYAVDPAWQVRTLALGIPVAAATGTTSSHRPALQVEGTTAYIRTAKLLSVLDISNPSEPRRLAELPLARFGNEVPHLLVHGPQMFAATDKGLQAFDVHEPEQPRALYTLPLLYWGYTLGTFAVDEARIYIRQYGSGGVWVYAR